MLDLLDSHQSFDVLSEFIGRTVYLRLSGEVDMATASVLEARLATAERHAHLEMVVDLAKVTFMDSSGVHALVRAEARASQDGRKFSIVNAPPIVARVFQLTRSSYLLS